MKDMNNTFKNIFNINKGQILFIIFISIVAALDLVLGKAFTNLYYGYVKQIYFEIPYTENPLLVSYYGSHSNSIAFMGNHILAHSSTAIFLALAFFVSPWRFLLNNKKGIIFSLSLFIVFIVTLIHYSNNGGLRGQGYWENKYLFVLLMFLTIPATIHLSILFLSGLFYLSQRNITKNELLVAINKNYVLLFLTIIFGVGFYYLVQFVFIELRDYLQQNYGIIYPAIIIAIIYISIRLFRSILDKSKSVKLKIDQEILFFLLLLAIPTVVTGIWYFILQTVNAKSVSTLIMLSIISNILAVCSSGFVTALIINNSSSYNEHDV